MNKFCYRSISISVKDTIKGISIYKRDDYQFYHILNEFFTEQLPINVAFPVTMEHEDVILNRMLERWKKQL